LRQTPWGDTQEKGSGARWGAHGKDTVEGPTVRSGVTIGVCPEHDVPAGWIRRRRRVATSGIDPPAIRT